MIVFLIRQARKQKQKGCVSHLKLLHYAAPRGHTRSRGWRITRAVNPRGQFLVNTGARISVLVACGERVFPQRVPMFPMFVPSLSW